MKGYWPARHNIKHGRSCAETICSCTSMQLRSSMRSSMLVTFAARRCRLAALHMQAILKQSMTLALRGTAGTPESCQAVLELPCACCAIDSFK